MSNFSNRLKAIRKEQKLRQQDVATAAGLTVRGYQYFESGNQEPTISSAIALADALNVSLDYLAGRTDNPEVNR